MVSAVASEAQADGRRQRRDRNRSAVVDAVLALYDEGELTPSAESVAARAGISARSLFRYFEDLEDLVGEAITRQQERLAPLWAMPVDTGAPFDDRVEAFVAARARLLEAMGNVGQVARLRAPGVPALSAELRRIRARLREQVQELFAAELAALGPTEAPLALASADVAASWEAYHLLRRDQGLSAAAARRAMARSLRRLLEAT